MEGICPKKQEELRRKSQKGGILIAKVIKLTAPILEEGKMERFENHWHELVKEESGRFVLYSEAMEEIEKLKAWYTEQWKHNDAERDKEIKRLEGEIAELKAEIVSGVLRDHDACLIQKDEEYTKLEVKYNNLYSKLTRLTALINDKEKVEKVILGCGNKYHLAYSLHIYRAMLREEME